MLASGTHTTSAATQDFGGYTVETVVFRYIFVTSLSTSLFESLLEGAPSGGNRATQKHVLRAVDGALELIERMSLTEPTLAARNELIEIATWVDSNALGLERSEVLKLKQWFEHAMSVVSITFGLHDYTRSVKPDGLRITTSAIGTVTLSVYRSIATFVHSVFENPPDDLADAGGLVVDAMRFCIDINKEIQERGSLGFESVPKATDFVLGCIQVASRDLRTAVLELFVEPTVSDFKTTMALWTPA